jgi:hypothetical protein
MAQVPASSHGGGLPLTGGTLTGPVIVDASAGLANGVKVISADAGSASIRVTDSASLLDLFKVNTDGDVTISGIHDIHAGSGSLLIQASPDGAPGTMFSVVNAVPAVVFGVPSGGGLFTAPPAPGTVQLVTATAHQMSAAIDLRTYTPVTFNPGAATTATCAVAISPDNITFTTLWTETEPAGVALDGTIHGLQVYVPALWYLRLTVNAQAVLGLTSYY